MVVDEEVELAVYRASLLDAGELEPGDSRRAGEGLVSMYF